MNLRTVERQMILELGALRHSPPILGFPRLGGTGTPGPARSALSIA